MRRGKRGWEKMGKRMSKNNNIEEEEEQKEGRRHTAKPSKTITEK